jgi:predicted nucleic acid-binding protein
LSWLCLIKHKWIYKIEDITLLQGVYTKYVVTKPTDVRFCERCHKKQKSRWTSLNSIKNLRNSDWIDSGLNKSESRDKKLKELGI